MNTDAEPKPIEDPFQPPQRPASDEGSQVPLKVWFWLQFGLGCIIAILLGVAVSVYIEFFTERYQAPGQTVADYTEFYRGMVIYPILFMIIWFVVLVSGWSFHLERRSRKSKS